MKPRKTIIFIFIGALIHSGGGLRAASTTNVANLTGALEKYCVPKCYSNCTGAFRAKYNAATNKCECAGGGILAYDKDLRECFLKCPAGSSYSTQAKCGAGMLKYEIIPILNQ
jgi:hypothetical protein